jgi:hypothetical protein
MSLKEAFPILYKIASVKDASMEDNMDFLNGSLQRNVSFFHLAHDWEVDVLASFYTLLYSHRVSREGEDKLWWAPSSKEKFNTSSFYKILTCKDAPSIPWKSIWRTKAPLKVALFIWSMAQGKILTMDNLRKRHLTVLMQAEQGAVNHLLLHCEVGSALWNVLFSRSSLSLVMPNQVAYLFDCWWSRGRSRSAIVWKMAPLCLM